jgi:hypothetical protein
MTDIGRALEQIAEIHAHLAKAEVYRGWRSLPVALSGAVGLGAAAWQSVTGSPGGDVRDVIGFWLAIGLAAVAVGTAEIAWRYVRRASDLERRRTRQVFGQLVPALAAGAAATAAVMRAHPASAPLLPGLWAMFFGVGVFAARPYLPRAGVVVAAYYWSAGAVLMVLAPASTAAMGWAIGGTFGAGQLMAAAVLYWSLERGE